MKSHRHLLIVLGAASFALLCSDRAWSQVCTLTWNGTVSGLFTDAGRWTAIPGTPCAGRAPLPGENIAFRPGTYTVTFPGGQSTLVAEFDIGSSRADITFALGGSFTTKDLATSGQLTVSGSGTLAVTELYNMGPDANFVLDKATATFSTISPSLPGPPDPSRRILVRNRGTLITLAGAPGVTVDDAIWKHQGPANAVSDITILNSGQLETKTLNLRSQRVRVEGGSILDVPDFTTTSTVLIRSGSQMINRTANLSFGDQIVDGTGSKWTITGSLTVPEAVKIISTNRAELICEEVLFADPNGFASIAASGTDSRVRIQKPLKLFLGNATANDGGIFAVSAVEVGGARQINVQRGPAGLGGAQFNCTGEMLIGTTKTTPGNGSVAVSGGGRASAQSVSIGHSTSLSALTVDAGNNTGSARFDITEKILVGEEGRGSLRVSNGARLGFTGPGFIIVTPDSNGDGEVTVEGTDSLLDLTAGYMHVGRDGPGRLNVTTGAKMLADGLHIGDYFGPTNRTATISGANSTVQIQGQAYVSSGTLRAFSNGFLQITSDVVEGSLIMESPAVVDLVGGKIEVGNAGGSPVGILRVDRGLLRGNGTIRANSVEVIAQGRCQPGETATRDVRIQDLRIQTGSYLQDANGTLVIDVSGTGAKEFGTLTVDRGVSLNGKLVVNFRGGFAPRAGDQFGLIRFGEARTGSFSSVTLNGLAPGVTYEQRQLAPGVYGLAFLSSGSPASCTDPRPIIERVDTSVPGEVTLTILAGTCGFHRLECSDDLKTWKWLRDFTGDASGRVRLVDRSRVLFSRRFYRVVRD